MQQRPSVTTGSRRSDDSRMAVSNARQIALQKERVPVPRNLEEATFVMNIADRDLDKISREIAAYKSGQSTRDQSWHHRARQAKKHLLRRRHQALIWCFQYASPEMALGEIQDLIAENIELTSALDNLEARAKRLEATVERLETRQAS